MKKILLAAALSTALVSSAVAANTIYSNNGYNVIKINRPFPGCSLRSDNAPANTKVIALEFFVDHQGNPHTYIAIVNTRWNLIKGDFLTISINGNNQFAEAVNSSLIITQLKGDLTTQVYNDVDDQADIDIDVNKLGFHQTWQLHYVAKANEVFSRCIAYVVQKYENGITQ